MANKTIYGCYNSSTKAITFEGEACDSGDYTGCYVASGEHAGQIAVTISEVNCNDTYYGCINSSTGAFQVIMPDSCCVEFADSDCCCFQDPAPAQWSSTTTYVWGDCVMYNSLQYYSKYLTDNLNHLPTDTQYWTRYYPCNDDKWNDYLPFGGIGKTPKYISVTFSGIPWPPSNWEHFPDCYISEEKILAAGTPNRKFILTGGGGCNWSYTEYPSVDYPNLRFQVSVGNYCCGSPLEIRLCLNDTGDYYWGYCSASYFVCNSDICGRCGWCYDLGWWYNFNYRQGQIARYPDSDGTNYYCIQDHKNKEPTVAAGWQNYWVIITDCELFEKPYFRSGAESAFLLVGMTDGIATIEI